MEPSIRILDIHEDIPLAILLLADPNEEEIYEYIRKGICFVIEIPTSSGPKIIGASVLVMSKRYHYEITNIAIDEHYQSQGYGKYLITHISEYVKEQKGSELMIGTANSSIMQLAFYQRYGFRMSYIEQGFFAKRYPEILYENGIPCRDRVVLIKAF